MDGQYLASNTNVQCVIQVVWHEKEGNATTTYHRPVHGTQSELPRSIPRNSVESDHGCTSRFYFDNADGNMKLTLYNVTLTSQKPCYHNNKCDCSKTNGLNEVNDFLNKISLKQYFIEKTLTPFTLLINIFG